MTMVMPHNRLPPKFSGIKYYTFISCKTSAVWGLAVLDWDWLAGLQADGYSFCSCFLHLWTVCDLRLIILMKGPIVQACFKPLCVCHLLKSHWLPQIPWQSPESGLGEVDPLPTGAGTWLCHIIAKPRRIETIILSTMQGEACKSRE